MQLELNLKQLSSIIKKDKGKSYLIEIPEGLKQRALEILQELQKTKKEFVLNIETTFGACDLLEDSITKTGCDSIIHFGHNKFVLQKIKQNVIYWPTFYSATKKELLKYVNDIERKFVMKKIVIVGPIQYENVILQIIKILEKNKKVQICEGKSTKRLNKTQILGCDCSSISDVRNNVNAIIYFGDGNFHFNALKEKAYKYDFNGKFEEQKIKERKSDAVFLIAKKVGIFVSSKIGQSNIIMAKKIKKELITQKKEVVILFGNELNNSKLLGMDLDLIVNTACPRINYDYSNYNKPILNTEEFFNLIKRYKLK